MAFGRKRSDEQEQDPAAESASPPPAPTGAGESGLLGTEEPIAVPAPGLEAAGAEPGHDAASSNFDPAGSAPGPALEPAGAQPGLEPANQAPDPGPERDAPSSGLDRDLREATAPAGDHAAAGVDAEEPYALPDQTATHDVGGTGGDPTAGAAPAASAPTTETTPYADPESVGSVAASPDPATLPAVHSTDGHGDADPGGADEDAGAADKASAAAAGAQSLVESRPEVLVAGAFVAGLVAARVLSALGGDR